MEIVTIPVDQVDEFYMHYPIKAWLFEKLSLNQSIFFIQSSQNRHYPIKAGNIS